MCDHPHDRRRRPREPRCNLAHRVLVLEQPPDRGGLLADLGEHLSAGARLLEGRAYRSPVIIETFSSASTSGVARIPTCRPRRKTQMRSEMRKT